MANRIVVVSRPRRTVLRVRQARWRSNERKLVTGRPSAVSPVVALRWAAGETAALATGEARWAWAAARWWSSNRIGASDWRMGHSR